MRGVAPVVHPELEGRRAREIEPGIVERAGQARPQRVRGNRSEGPARHREREHAAREVGALGVGERRIEVPLPHDPNGGVPVQLGHPAIRDLVETDPVEHLPLHDWARARDAAQGPPVDANREVDLVRGDRGASHGGKGEKRSQPGHHDRGSSSRARSRSSRGVRKGPARRRAIGDAPVPGRYPSTVDQVHTIHGSARTLRSHPRERASAVRRRESSQER